MFGMNSKAHHSSKAKTRRPPPRAGRARSTSNNYSSDDTAPYGAFLLDLVKGQAVFYGRRYRNIAAQIVSDLAISLYENLARGKSGTSSDIIGSAALGLAHTADTIRDLSVSRVVDTTEHLARRHPVLFLSAIAAGGLIAASLLKNSPSSRQDDRRATSRTR